jgi:hypothetical protein
VTDTKRNMSGRLGPLVALVSLALIGAGCSDELDGSGTGNKAAANQQALKFAECMRDNGVSEFPDPDASGSLTIDGVVNGSSIDPDGPAWDSAMSACKDMQPPGFTGDGDDEVTAEEQDARLEFAECIRDHGVKDFPDPADGEPLVNTYLIPSSDSPEGLAILNAAMEACGDLAEKAIGQ